MKVRTVGLVALLCSWASAAVAQSYEPPASPVAPTSYGQCDTLERQWSQISSQIEDAHQKCLEAHHAQAPDSRGASVCSHPACQSLHAARIEIRQSAAEQVQACRTEVAQFQKTPHSAAQQEHPQEKKQPMQEHAVDVAKEQALQLQQTRSEAAEKISAALAANENALQQNLRSIQQVHSSAPKPAPLAVSPSAISGVPPAGAASPSVPPMTSGQLQMLQGLLTGSSADGAGADPNSAAILNALQTAGQGNLIQQTANQQTAAMLAIGAANDAARKAAATQGHPGTPQRITPEPMTTPNAAPGHPSNNVPASPAAGPSRGVTASGRNYSASGNESSGSTDPPAQQGLNSSTLGTPRQMFVAFAFSTLGLHGFGGDGGWGIGVDHDEQKAMDQSGVYCAMGSQVPDWCGTANGGHYEVCKSDRKTRWVALATNNDGDSLDWSDGEAIGALSQAEAIQSALANCGRSGCQLQTSMPISCISDGTSGSDGASGAGVSPQRKGSGSYVPSIDGSCIHQFWDSTLYGWFAFRNDCGRPVHITFIAISPNDNFGPAATDLDPGQSGDTGWSKSEVAAKGGFDVYVCPVGAIAVDAATGQSIEKPNVKFVCKKIYGP